MAVKPGDAAEPGGLARELKRASVRTINGLKLLAGTEFAPVHPTPSDVIWREGKAEMRRYHRDTPARFGPPVVTLLGLVGRSYVFDLYKSGSIVQMLMDWGFDAYVMDWGDTDELDSGNTLETYLQHYLPRALEAVSEVSGYDDVNFLAYCMGGLMLVHGLAGKAPIAARSIVTLASPFDMRHLGPTFDAIREGKLTADGLLDETGNVPGPLIVRSFKRRKPTYDLVSYAKLWDNLESDRYLEGYQAIARFLSDYPPVSGAALRQLIDQWMVGNAFMTNGLRFADRRANLANVRCPILAVIAEKDEITPLPSTAPIEDILPNARVELLRVNAGHVSLFIGRDAVKVVMPKIFEWIEGHSEETERKSEIRERTGRRSRPA